MFLLYIEVKEVKADEKKLLLLLVIFVVTGCGSSSVPVRNFEANLLGLQPEDYTELHFDLAYPETLQIDGMKDGKIYFEGFGWVDYNGGGTSGIQGDDIYENGNTIGIMD